MERAELRALVEATGCAEASGDGCFLRDPAWSAGQLAQWRECLARADRRPAGETGGWFGVATGGTSGGIKVARHDEYTLTAPVEGLRAHFGFRRINAVDVLPAHHVSGLMALVRAAATGGEHRAWTWKQLERGELAPLGAREDGWVISLVPTQLQRLLAAPAAVAWLREFRVIFLGGGPVWPDLAAAARRAELPVALSYGMTETAAMVTALRPDEFLAGRGDCGTALPHARIAIDADGVVRVTGTSVFRGYWPDWREEREFVTEDLGVIDAGGHLAVLGRRDAVIITGGKKVQPAEVEAVLRAGGAPPEVVVLGVPDSEWGEVVVACFPAGAGQAADWTTAAAPLAAHQRPKHHLAVERWPANRQGKVNRAELKAAVAGLLARRG
jgi:O-succinylbenzoic acid--CoA ligase